MFNALLVALFGTTRVITMMAFNSLPLLIPFGMVLAVVVVMGCFGIKIAKIIKK